MIRPLALSLAAGLALAAAPCRGADEIFPAMHSEPITVRILNGKNGQPLAHLHLILIGGYDQRDLHGQLFREEALTDAQGQARLSGQLANLPWLQVWVNKKPLSRPTRPGPASASSASAATGSARPIAAVWSRSRTPPASSPSSSRAKRRRLLWN